MYQLLKSETTGEALVVWTDQSGAKFASPWLNADEVQEIIDTPASMLDYECDLDWEHQDGMTVLVTA